MWTKQTIVLDRDFAVLYLVIMLSLGEILFQGKVNPLKKLSKHAMAIKVFSELGDKETVNMK